MGVRVLGGMWASNECGSCLGKAMIHHVIWEEL